MASRVIMLPPGASPARVSPFAMVLEGLRQGDDTPQNASLQRIQVPQTDDALWNYMDLTWGVRVPRLAICPGHVAPFTAFADAYFARDSMLVWEASRGFGGKSFLLALLGLAIACTRGGDVNILGGSGQQSQRVHEYMSRAWDAPQAPREHLRSDPMGMRTRLMDGSIIQALLASPTSVRGPHCPTLLLDECDEFELRIFEAALGQTMAQPERPAVTVMSSTHQYSDGTMTEIKRRVAAKGWKMATWCYRETLQPHGWLEPEEVERKRREVTVAMFASEYDLQEPSPEGRAIDPDAVTACFQRSLGEYEGKAREYIEIESPVVGARYAHGADWAKSVDWTEIVTLRCDCSPYRLVAYERMQRLSWPTMVGRFDARVTRYALKQHTWAACHDKTGLGDVVEGYLEHDVDGIMMVGRARADLFSECINGIEDGKIISPFITSLEGQVRFCTNTDLYGSGHPPDGFVALALAYRAAKKKPRSGWVAPVGLQRGSE